MDSIMLEGLQFYGFHGVNAEERSLGQRFLVDLELTTDLRRAGQTDDLADTISYSDVYRRAQAIVEGVPSNLLEAVADRIASALLAEFAVTKVTVVVRKLSPPIRGASVGVAGVRIVRSRASDDPNALESDA